MTLEVCRCGKDSVIVLNFKGLCSSCFKKKTGCDDPAFYRGWLKSQGKRKKDTSRDALMGAKITRAKNGYL